MMKIYSKISVLVLLFVVMGLVISPIFVLAKNDTLGQNGKNNNKPDNQLVNASSTPRQSGKENDNAKGNINFCSNINKMIQSEQKLVEAQTKIEEKRQEQQQKVAQRWVERNTKQEKTRNKWDENRDEFFTKLEEKAGTDAQKQALLAFRKTVTIAITARRAAIDSAIESFRKEVEESIASKKISADLLVNAFKNEVQVAINKAKADCTLTNPDSIAIRTAFEASVKIAKEKFEINRKNIEKLNDSLQVLIDAKKHVIEKATTDFKVAMEAARTVLKAIFSQESTPTPTTTPTPTPTATPTPTL